MRNTLKLMLLCCSVAVIAFSQDYPFLRNVQVRSSVSKQGPGQMLLFSLHLFNDPTSVGSIQAVDIDISRSPNSIDLDTTGLKFNSQLEETFFRRRFASLRERVVPVGIPSLPGSEWLAMLTNRGTLSISADSKFVPPGESVDGIVLMSKGLPAIRYFVVEPNFQDDRLFPSLDDTARTITVSQMDSIREAVNYFGRTIGPTAPPNPFIHLAFLDTLFSYTRQSAELGWLGKGKDEDCDKDERPEVGIVRNIESRLQKAGRELERGDSVKARGELEKLIAKVERIWKRSEKQEGQREGKDRKHRGERGKGEPVIMTSEGYALLKYNTEFLIERLPPIKKKTRNDRG